MRGYTIAAGAAAAAGIYRLVVRGALTIDTGWGRQVRPLESFSIEVDAPPEVVFDVIAEPYLGRTPRALAGKVHVLERGTDMVLAAHNTPVWPGLVATTVETVRFDRPSSVRFRLLKGPVPEVTEQFLLHALGTGTRLDYQGDLGTDFWAAGRWWGERVASVWQKTVRSSCSAIKAEAERRAGSR